MKNFDRFTKWMEDNLETPLYEAEMVRVNLFKEEHADTKHDDHQKHKKS